MLSSCTAVSRVNFGASAHGHGHGHGGSGQSAESPIAKTLIGGGITLVFECFGGGHFLEFLKIAKQTTPSESYFQIFKRVTANKGVAGMIDGFLPWGAIQALTKGAVFGWGHAASMVLLHDTTAISEDTKTIISGGVGGLVQGVFMSPILLLKTRVMTNPDFRTSGGVFTTAVASAKVGMDTIRAEGVMALTKGMGVFSFKRMADWTTRYFFVVQVENWYSGGRKLTTWESSACSMAGGTLSALSTIPFDVLVATFMSASKAGQKVSIVDTYKALMSQGIGETLKFSTRGLVARVAHVGLTTVMMKTVSSAIYDLILR